MIVFARSLIDFYTSLFSAYVSRNDVFVPPERDWTD